MKKKQSRVLNLFLLTANLVMAYIHEKAVNQKALVKETYFSLQKQTAVFKKNENENFVWRVHAAHEIDLRRYSRVRAPILLYLTYQHFYAPGPHLFYGDFCHQSCLLMMTVKF